MKRLLLVVMIAVLAAPLVVLPRSARAATTGSWTAYPGQTALHETSVQQPINADGSSVFNAKRGAIPVKFSLAAGTGPFVFESILSDADPDNDFSFLSFTPDAPLTFNDLTTLTADYAYILGNCGGGALRWSVRIDVGNDGNTANDGSIFIYYGDHPNFTDCTTTNQSGVNMIGNPDLRYDLTQLGGPFYGSYADAQAAAGTFPVVRASLVVDTGWFAGDDELTIGGATVNDNTFTPAPASAPAPTCDLPAGEILVTKLTGSNAGVVTEATSVQPHDNDALFRRVDCKYMYNLDVRSLRGPGEYQVEVVIDGVPAAGAAVFALQ